jgi:hypothetical protein
MNKMGIDKSIEIAKKLDKLMDHIREVAEKNCWADDQEFMVYNYCGGNMDDAYESGMEAGEVLFARRLQKLIEGE